MKFTLSRAELEEHVRHLARDGLDDHAIAKATELDVQSVRRILARRTDVRTSARRGSA